MIELKTYKNQTEVDKVFTCETYDLMYGTVEDIFSILEQIDDYNNQAEVLKVISKNRESLNRLILDVFPEMGKDDLSKIKVKDFFPFVTELISYVSSTFTKN